MSILLRDSDLNCLCLCETYLNNSITDGEIDIPGYMCSRNDRDANSGKLMGEGLLAYTKNNRNFQEIPNSHVCSPHIESFWLRLHLKKSKNYKHLCSVSPA